jgi:hypothetical protein
VRPFVPSSMTFPNDTSPAAEQFIIEGLRRLSPAEKLERVASLNRALVSLATARLRARYGGDMSPRELRLRLASLWIDEKVMREVFDWDPAVMGR